MVAALYKTKMTKPHTQSDEISESTSNELSVSIDNPEKCHTTVQE